MHMYFMRDYNLVLEDLCTIFYLGKYLKETHLNYLLENAEIYKRYTQMIVRNREKLKKKLLNEN